MKTFALAAGAAALLMTAGAADAATKHRSGGAIASPAQPIPYAMVDEYVAASPKERESRDWWSGSNMAATTGASTNAASTTSADGMNSTGAQSSSDMSGAPAGQVNTPTDSMGSTSPSDGSSSSTTPP